MEWSPLELWCASGLQQETRVCESAYRRAVSSGDHAKVAAIRDSIEQRTDDLEAFYAANVDEESAMLFEKQRMKLRKLLHEMTPVARTAPGGSGAGGSGGGVGSGSGSGSGSGVTPPSPPTKTIREDTRLTLVELTAWYLQAGVKTMPELSEDVVGRVYRSLSERTEDGKLSIREFRQWYATFGKGALEATAAATRAVGAGESKREAPSSARKAKGAGATPRKGKAGGATPRKGKAGAKTPGSVKKGTPRSARPSGPIYDWELRDPKVHVPVGPTSPAGRVPRLGRGRAEDVPTTPVAFKDKFIEFQVRLTEDEYKTVQLRKRAAEAEGRHKKRTATALTARKPAVKQPETTSLLVTGPYVEPSTLEYNLYRAPQPKKWLTSRGFEAHAATKASPATTPIRTA